MARRGQRAGRPKAEEARDQPVEIPAAPAAGASPDVHLVVFRVADETFAFPIEAIAEVILPPRLAHMPLAPRSLLGLANLRGVVLPVVGMRLLLRLPEKSVDEAARVIVIDRGVSVGFLVDRIDDLLAVATDRIEKDDAGAGAVDPDMLDGVVKGAEGEGTIKILKPQRLLRDEFARLGVSSRPAPAHSAASAAGPIPQAAEARHQLSLVSFDLARQEYALPLDCVREIIPLPDHVSEVARSETAVLGVVTLRDRLLPLVSLRALLGLPSDVQREERGKVVVLSLGNGSVGMVADSTREILRVDHDMMEPAPALLTRGAGDAEITSICRLDHGKRLVAVLSPDRLFRSDLVRRILSEQVNAGEGAEGEAEHAMAGQQYVIFRLGDQDYGLPIAAVEEIANPPEHITRLPKVPPFIDGVINLRGSVVPIVDLRRRFDIASTEPGRAKRILILALGGGKTGFMVDGVSEVMIVPDDAVRPAPDLSPEQMRLIGRVANLDAQDRMILLVDPAHLLDQVEADVLANFDRTGLDRISKAS